MTAAPRRAVLVVGLVGLAIASLVSLRVLAESDWDATRFVAFGEDASATREYGEERLGELYVRAGQGHDGKFFFVQANDPWVLEPSTNAEILDRPLYRSQRMLYPVVAGLGGAASSDVIVWSMLAVNIVAMGVGSAVVAHISMLMGGSAWLGVSFALNPGFMSEMTIDGAGVFAGVFMFAAAAAVLRERMWLAGALMTGSVLSREVFLLSVAGIAIWLWSRTSPRDVLRVVIPPVLAVGIWAVYLRLRIDSESALSEVQEVGWPGQGVFEAFGIWLDDPINLVFGLLILAIAGFFTMRSLRQRELIGYVALGFVLLSLFLTKPVWTSYFDISRALAPVITAYLLLVLIRPHARTSQPSTDARSLSA